MHESSPSYTAAFELSIVNAETGKETLRRKATAYQVAIPLPPGRYRWRVSHAASQRRSAERVLEVVDPKRAQTSLARRELMRQVIRSGQSAAVSLEDGI